MAKRHSNLIVGLDIGTTKICAIVADVSGETIEVVGVGTSPCHGLRKGVVINIETTVSSIRAAIEEAELMAGCEINGVYVGIAGGHIRALNSHGVIPLKNREVRTTDVKRVIEAATAVHIPMDREVIHTLPQEFIIDEQDGIRDPLGMSGVRLEAWVHIVTGAVTSAQNLIKCANRTGLTVHDIVLQPIASAEAVLSEDERELGVALIDIGGGTSDLAIFADGAIRHTSVLSVGGNHVTNDIAVGLRTPSIEAERIKIEHGSALTSLVREDEVIQVPSVGGRKPRKLSRRVLAEIIEARAEEMLRLTHREMVRAGLEDSVASGIVLTGGSSMLAGLPELAEQIFDLPVRRGVPRDIAGLVDVVNGPKYATGVGLVRFGHREANGTDIARVREENIFSRVATRMQQWFDHLRT